MSQEAVRLSFFLFGLFTLLSWELAAPHHPPAAPRLLRWFSNLTLAVINGAVVAFLCTTCFLLARHGALPWRIGLFEILHLPTPVRVGVEVLVLDLLVYFLHRAYHRYPLLWRFHSVHHSDRDLDVTSASRFHVGEVAASGVVKFACVQALGISPVGLVCFEVVMLLAAQFQHANVRLPVAVENFLWWILVPPGMHRVHHHPSREATDSNFGTLVSVWDRIFGTLRRTSPSDREFGLVSLPNPRALGLLRLLWLPFRKAG